MKAFAAAALATILIPVPQWGNISLIEAIWVAVGLVALAISTVSIPKVVADYVLSRHAPPSPLGDARILLARGHVRRELIRTAQAWVIILVGIVAALTPNPLTSVTLTGLAVVTGLVSLAALVALQSLLDKFQREHAESILAQAEAEGDPQE